MNKTLIVVALMSSAMVMAQRGKKGKHNPYKDFTTEQVATLQTKKLTLVLDLTQEQQAQVKSLQLEKAEQRQKMMEKRKAAREEKDKKPSSEERYAMQNERLDQQIALKEKMKTILNEEQYTKWNQLQMKRGKHRGKKGKNKGRHTDK